MQSIHPLTIHALRGEISLSIVLRTKYIYSTVYKEYHKFTVYVPSSKLGLSQPFSRQRVCPSPRNQRGGDSLACGWGLEESQFRRLEKSLALCLPTLWWYVQQQELIVTHTVDAKPLLEQQVRPPSNLPSHIAKNQYRKFQTNIPRKGIARPQSQFPHMWAIYKFPQSIYL